MDKSDLELFKQAISEGLSQKFDSVVDNYTEKIVCSERHELAMKTIVYGKADVKRAWSPKMKRIIAILVVAALLLTSCAIIFHNEICEIVGDLFAKYVYSGDDNGINTIEEVYELGYLPEGYYLDNKIVSHTTAKLSYVNNQGDFIKFEQRILDRSGFAVDSEKGYSHIKEINSVNIYYRYTGGNYLYIWNNSKYSLSLKSNKELSNGEIVLILDGLKIK